MKKIFITDYFLEAKIEKKIFGKSVKVICLNKKNENNFPHAIKEADGLLVWHTNITQQTIKNLKKCKGIVRYGVGCDNIDLSSARNFKIDCANTPDYGIGEVADTASAMILSLSRKIMKYNESCKYYKKGWQENVLNENLSSPIKRTNEHFLGIIGAGRIGSALALRMKPFGIKMGFYDPYVSSGHEKVLGIKRFKSLKELSSNCTIISINSVLTKETSGMINKKFINSLKKGTILINTARGEIINKLDDLYSGLKTGKLGGIGLDVLPDEPPIKNEKLIKFWKNSKHPLSKKIIINPHAAYYSSRSIIEMRVKAAENLNRVFKGLKLRNIVN